MLLAKNVLLVALGLAECVLKVIRLKFCIIVVIKNLWALIRKSSKIYFLLILRKRNDLILRLRYLLVGLTKFIILCVKRQWRCCCTRLNVFFVFLLIFKTNILKIAILKWLRVWCQKVFTKNILWLNINTYIILKWLFLIFILNLGWSSEYIILNRFLIILAIILIVLNAEIALRVFILINSFFSECKWVLILVEHYFILF